MPITNFVWDETTDNVVRETNGNGETTVNYTSMSGSFGSLVSQKRGPDSSYYLYDGMGSTRNLTNDSEVVTDTYYFTAFGENVSSSGATSNPFKYKGELQYYSDTDTNDIYVRERFLSPSYGRWTSCDPAMFVDGSNRYTYVQNQPILYADPSGLFTLDESQSKEYWRVYERYRTNWPNHGGFDLGPGPRPQNDFAQDPDFQGIKSLSTMVAYAVCGTYAHIEIAARISAANAAKYDVYSFKEIQTIVKGITGKTVAQIRLRPDIVLNLRGTNCADVYEIKPMGWNKFLTQTQLSIYLLSLQLEGVKAIAGTGIHKEVNSSVSVAVFWPRINHFCGNIVWWFAGNGEISYNWVPRLRLPKPLPKPWPIGYPKPVGGPVIIPGYLPKRFPKRIPRPGFFPFPRTGPIGPVFFPPLIDPMWQIEQELKKAQPYYS